MTNIQPWCTPFPIWNQSVVPCRVLAIASWPAYRFLRRQVRWSDIPISLRIFQFVVIHTVCFSIVNEAEVHVFLEFSCFFYDLMDVGNLISDSSAFSKSSLNIWKFAVHVLVKPSLENFDLSTANIFHWSLCRNQPEKITFLSESISRVPSSLNPYKSLICVLLDWDYTKKIPVRNRRLGFK